MSLLSRPSRTITAGAALVFGSPIDITDALIASNGGPVFDGLVIENTSYSANNGAAIYVTSSQAVTIQNCTLKAQKYCISSLTNGSNITVRNSIGVVKNTTQAGQPAQRFLNLGQPASVVCENNTMIGGGILLSGNSTATGRIAVIRYNRMINVDGRLSDGAGGYVYERGNVANVYFQAKQFIQVNTVTLDGGSEIAWNEIINDPFVSRPEDTMNFTNGAGVSGAPIRVHDNYIQGGCPTTPYVSTYSGCGFLTENTSNWIDFDDNQVVGYDNIGAHSAGGIHQNWRRNRLVSAGNVFGRAMASRNRAMYIGSGSATYIVVDDTVWSWNNAASAQAGIGWNGNTGNTGNSETGTVALGGPTTEAHEAAELAIWRAKVAAAGVTIGSTLAV